MIKNFNHFKARDCFFCKTVKNTKALLLHRVMLGRALTCIACINHNQNIKENGNKRQLPVKNNEQHKRTNHLNKRQNKVGKAVIERFRDGIHVICKEAHDIAAGTLVKKLER